MESFSTMSPGFPSLIWIPTDPQTGLKLAWNFYWRWLGDDVREGGGTKQARSFAMPLKKTDRNAVRMSSIILSGLAAGLPWSQNPILPGYEHIDWMQIRADEYPRDTSGTTTLEIRYADRNREDDLYIYVPSIRRVRRAPPIQRCGTTSSQ